MANKTVVDESGLVSRLREGEMGAFNQLFRLYYPKLTHFALGYLKSREDAEEVVQDVFVKVWEKRAELEEGKSFSGFVFKIAFNATLNRIRKKSSEKAYRSHLQHTSDLMHNETQDGILLADFEAISRRAIDKLPARRQLIYRLSRQDGLTNRQIAEKLLISSKTVEVQISEALKFLRKQLSRLTSDLFLLFFLLSLP